MSQKNVRRLTETEITTHLKENKPITREFRSAFYRFLKAEGRNRVQDQKGYLIQHPDFLKILTRDKFQSLFVKPEQAAIKQEDASFFHQFEKIQFSENPNIVDIFRYFDEKFIRSDTGYTQERLAHFRKILKLKKWEDVEKHLKETPVSGSVSTLSFGLFPNWSNMYGETVEKLTEADWKKLKHQNTKGYVLARIKLWERLLPEATTAATLTK